MFAVAKSFNEASHRPAIFSWKKDVRLLQKCEPSATSVA